MNNSKIWRYLILSFFTVFLLLHNHLNAVESYSTMNNESLEEDAKKIFEFSHEYAKFYTLPEGVEIHEITEDLLESPYVKEVRKKAIQEFGRRIFVFVYPSDGLKIKGLISFVPNPQDYPTLYFLRGGNKIFGIPNPAGDLLCPEQYTVIATAYRDGVSEGVDEFGGKDVDDVKNLIDFIPSLEEKLSIQIQKEKMFLLGSSRGGMQMFLTLGRYPEIQSRFSKIVSLSGLLDMRKCIELRSDMKEMFISDFGLIENENEAEWINWRDPLLMADKIRKDLPILIIQGTQDIRVDLEEGYSMLNKLEATGHQVTYLEIEGADHCLFNQEDRVKLILSWLEQ